MDPLNLGCFAGHVDTRPPVMGCCAQCACQSTPKGVVTAGSPFVPFQLCLSTHAPRSLNSYGNLESPTTFLRGLVRHLSGLIWKKTHHHTELAAHSDGQTSRRPRSLVWEEPRNLWSRLTWLNLWVWVQGVSWLQLLRSCSSSRRLQVTWLV